MKKKTDETTLLFDSFFINLLGYFSLYNIKNDGYIRVYISNEKDVQLEQIKSTNNASSFFLKELYKNDYIQDYHARKIANILKLIKFDHNSEYHVQESDVDEIIYSVRYWITHTSYRVKNIIYDFLNRNISLNDVAYKIYQLSKNNHYTPICYEINKIIKKGHYLDFIEKNN